MRRWLTILIGLFLLGVFRSDVSEAKLPGWQPGEHPRLLATAAEKSAIVAKLTTSGTASATIWSAFLTSSMRSNFRNYADGAFYYWITGNLTTGNQAVGKGEEWMNNYPQGLDPNGSSFNELWYNYEDFLLIYDFAYPLLTAQQRTEWRQYIALQGSKCDAVGTGWAPGNINTPWMFCEYASAVELENEVVPIVVTDESVVHSSLNAAEKPLYPINISGFKISDAPGSPTADYTEGVDYIYRYTPTCGNSCIDWSPSGVGTKEPTPGSNYYLSYTFTPNIAAWKSNARVAIENHLNYQWHDGYYNGGLSPYGNLVTEQLPLFSEMLKRDIGVDLSRNPDIKRIVDMYLYSELPSAPPGVNRRFNTINDTAGWTSFDADALNYPSQSFATYKSWLRPFVAWGTTQYANDPEEYGQRYTWLWTHAYRNTNGTIRYSNVPDWREALWINNSALAPYLNTTAVPPATWPSTRYFRGKEVVYARTDSWNAPDSSAALMSMVAGNHNYQNEHDQGDAGSFTFFSLNEDWVIDPGYTTADGGASLTDHAGLGIDNHGYDASGIYGRSSATPEFGGFAHFDDVALTTSGSAMVADLTKAWTLTSTPYVDHDQRYAALVNGSQSSYLVVADDLKKDTSLHSYEWYLPTGLGNTTSIAGNQATVTGARGSGVMDVYSLGPSASTWTVSSSSAGTLGTHDVLKDRATGVTNANFLHLLLPRSVGSAAPQVAQSSISNGIAATLTWADGTQDIILWRTDNGTVSFGGLVSDAKVTILRSQAGVISGFMALAGRSATWNGTPVLTVLDGTAPVTVSAMGTTAGLYAADAAKIRLGLPYVTAATLEDGQQAIDTYTDGAVTYINGGLPLAQLRRNNGQLYSATFDDQSVHDLTRFNISVNPAEEFAISGGALDLQQTPYEWPSFSRRDTTPLRRSALFPTLLDSTESGDADYSFRYKFSGAPGSDGIFRAYFRVTDRNPIDWLVNQDYVRLELKAKQGGLVKNEVTLGQRVNGSWSTIGDNDNLTASLPTVSVSLNDNQWHDVTVRLLGDAATVMIDGVVVVNGTLPTTVPTAPAAGYAQWKVLGSTHVLLDSFSVAAIDQTTPAAPTAGTIIMAADGSGSLSVNYAHGISTDAIGLNLYESDLPILSSADPSGLTLRSTTTASTTSLGITGGDQIKNYAAAVIDTAGNLSSLLPLVIDLTAPARTADLQTL